MDSPTIDLCAIFDQVRRDGETVAAFARARRQRLRGASWEALHDSFGDGPCRCLFWRGEGIGLAELRLGGSYRMTTSDAGGWLLVVQEAGKANYWFPCLPTIRRLDEHGRILAEAQCPVASLSVDAGGVAVRLGPVEGRNLDVVVWELDPGDEGPLPALLALDGAERHPVYLWGSHGVYRQPADLYRHIVQGSIFDLRFSWPYKRRAYSENEAHALYLALRNRELATGKSFYRHLRDQVLLSLIARQDADGAWRQGIWTRDLERHFRLHNKAMHLLMDAYCEEPDPALLDPLARAADHLSGQATEVMGEAWFLHDSLEQDEEAIRASLPGWRCCGNAMKTPANTLVLNTHVDTLIVLHRYRQISGRSDFDEQIASARRILHRLLELRPAERLYRLVYGAVYLTLLPAERAKTLPLPLRALKRLARERLVPLLPSLKCRYPRLVMPGGFIDRALSLQGIAHAYLGIHLMDLARYERCFPGQDAVGRAVTGMLAFAEKWDLLTAWAEDPHACYGIGYWVEALYQLALLDERRELRYALGDTAILAERSGLGLPPSMCGTNLEMLALERQRPCPLPTDPRLRTINLARDDRREYLFLNPEAEAVPFSLRDPVQGLSWQTTGGRPGEEPPAMLPAGQWLLAAPA